jgi:hypothetical protein
VTVRKTSPPKSKTKRKRSPMQMALAEMRLRGWIAEITEHWNPFARTRNDLLGIFDLIAICDTYLVKRIDDDGYERIPCQPHLLGVQVTSGDHHAHRRGKMLAHPNLRAWLATGAKAEIWSYAKRGGRGFAKKWERRREELTLTDLQSVPENPDLHGQEVDTTTPS